MKKIVALSTLSQLGLIIATLGLGLYEVAFFHMVSHAFFKALLFISVGNIIHLSRDFQDLRKIGLLEGCFPTTLAFSLIANWSLCGLPFLAGFYSKDIILELMLMAKVNIILNLIFFLAVGLTIAYTTRFIVLTSLGGLNSSTAAMGADNDTHINFSIAVLWPLAIMGGSVLS
jgi:NADH-ubiquinone oxidoreductase chain 5